MESVPVLPSPPLKSAFATVHVVPLFVDVHTWAPLSTAKSVVPTAVSPSTLPPPPLKSAFICVQAERIESPVAVRNQSPLTPVQIAPIVVSIDQGPRSPIVCRYPYLRAHVGREQGGAGRQGLRPCDLIPCSPCAPAIEHPGRERPRCSCA